VLEVQFHASGLAIALNLVCLKSILAFGTDYSRATGIPETILIVAGIRPFWDVSLEAQAVHRNRELLVQGGTDFHNADFTEVVFKSATYSLSGRTRHFPFLAMSRSGSQNISLLNWAARWLTPWPRRRIAEYPQ
jgi:hypothetical protein